MATELDRTTDCSPQLGSKVYGAWASHMVTQRALRKAATSLKRINCAQLFFIYPGRGAGLIGRDVTFLSMVRHAGLGDRNLALVADPYCENYTRGVGPEIPDLGSLLDWHRGLLRDFSHVTEFCHLGHSSGGYGALLFGHLLGAKKVWAFVPRTARPETADSAKAFLKEQLSKGSDAREFIIYYSLANPRDCAFAEYFAQCPGIVLSPYTVPQPLGVTRDTAPHVIEKHYHRAVLPAIINSGDLRQFMPPFRQAAGSDKPDAA
jgi:hypothetical protein